MKKSLALSIALITTLTGCLYQMPGDNSISTLPYSNNPHLTGEKSPSFMPGR